MKSIRTRVLLAADDSTLVDGHSISVGDFSRTGRDDIIVGERGGKRGVYLYRLENDVTDSWSTTPLDPGGMAAAGCAVTDLNGDTRPDVICSGSATAHLKWYENRP
ncbi:FG-GAP repeat domain-containing protein [Gemmatimonas groenlandica]|uniref:VCBS repeat-containing protein n=1 Tax=Gemmatimonas groenlandica TaxID=2732249 RepID=A0A6M4ING5_9BACT|nr:VCBS repeat-containing protein [Gemmatimonas groenlandica]QJR34542.1 VCBS repeat-containing protein [Gemmatimonas groenlandica]